MTTIWRGPYVGCKNGSRHSANECIEHVVILSTKLGSTCNHTELVVYISCAEA